MRVPDPTPRRGFVATAGAALAAAVLPGAAAAQAPVRGPVHDPVAAARGAGPAPPYDDRWLRRLDVPVKQVFDINRHANGDVFRFAKNYLNGMVDGWGVPAGQVHVVLVLHGSATVFAFDDPVWAKYRLGETVRLTDPATGAAAVRHAWRTGDPPHGIAVENAMATLQQRGASVLVCHNAVKRVSQELARRDGAEAATVLGDLEAGLAPGVLLVPAAVAAVGRAQHAGCSYVYAGG